MCDLRADTSASPELSCWDEYPGGRSPLWKQAAQQRLSGAGTEEWTTTRRHGGKKGVQSWQCEQTGCTWEPEHGRHRTAWMRLGQGVGTSGTAVTAGLSEDRCVGMGGTRTFWTGENCELTEVERKVVVLVCEEQGLLMAEFCGGDLVWTRPMTVSRLLLQPPCFLPSPDAGLPKDLKITDTNYTIMSFIAAGKSLLICKLTTDGCCFKC